MPGNGIAGTLGRGAARECVNHLLAQALSQRWRTACGGAAGARPLATGDCKAHSKVPTADADTLLITAPRETRHIPMASGALEYEPAAPPASWYDTSAQ
jgi:hypothetical protein